MLKGNHSTSDSAYYLQITSFDSKFGLQNGSVALDTESYIDDFKDQQKIMDQAKHPVSLSNIDKCIAFHEIGI